MPEQITVQDLIRREAQAAGIPVELALAVAEQESGFNPTLTNPQAVNGEHAVGTFQFLPSTAKARGIDPTDPVANIKGGVGYLRELLDRHQGNVGRVLTEYGGVRTNTTYVPDVLARLQKFRLPVPAQEAIAPTSRLGQSTSPTAPGPAQGQFLGDPTKAARLRLPPSPLERAHGIVQRAEGAYPWVGAGVGELVGGLPGAALGGAAGQAVASLSRTIRTGKVAPPTSTAATLVGEAPPGATPVQAGLRTAAQHAADLAQTAGTQGALSTGARAIGRVATGVLRPSAAQAGLLKANEELGLGLTIPQLAGETAAGTAGRLVVDVAERSLTGRMIQTVRQRVTRENALKGVAQGKEALARTGQALAETITVGPTHAMLPYKIEAAKIIGEEIAPKLLELKAGVLSPSMTAQLQAATTGGLSPDLALRVVRTARGALQRGAKEAVPTGSLDALEKILATADDISFDSATALRTGLLETSRKSQKMGDLLGERGLALTKKFTGDLTEGLSRAYPDWDPLRALYATGAKGLREPGIKKLVGAAPPEALDVATTAAKRLPVGEEANALHNLRYISEALKKTQRDPGGWTRVYNAFELASVGGALLTRGPGAALGVAATVELLPGLVTWAAHSPLMTKLLTQGLMTKNPTAAAALIGRVYGAYQATQGLEEAGANRPVPSHVAAPPPAAARR